MRSTAHHMNSALSVKGLRGDMKKVNGFNAKVAVLATNAVGTMWCAYAFALIALLGLAPALKSGGMGFVPWFAQTFLQLVLLSVIMVGQSVQSAAADQRAAQTLSDTEELLDKMDAKTEGGIKVILDAINAQHEEHLRLVEVNHKKQMDTIAKNHKEVLSHVKKPIVRVPKETPTKGTTNDRPVK